jgi:DNA-binding HxlR family transcriptional regulator
MNKSNPNLKTCTGSMQLLGDYWVLRIIYSLASGEARFTELARAVEGINPATLSSRLKKLEEAKLINRSEETVDKLSVTYSLTNLGKEALPVITALENFATKAASQ